MAAPSSALTATDSLNHETVKLSDVFPPKAPKPSLSESETLRRVLSFRRGAATLPGRTDENRPRTSARSVKQDVAPTLAAALDCEAKHSFTARNEHAENGCAFREAQNTARDRVGHDSVIVTEIKLNCKLEEEQSFLSDISFYLSEIFQRPVSCITVFLSVPQAMFLGGSSEPAYVMTVTALASQVAPTRNNQRTTLLQNFMLESLGISPRRGIVRFDPTADENLATNGMTARQEIEAIERNSGEASRALRTMSRNRSRRSRKSHTSPFKDRGRTLTSYITKQETTSPGEDRDTTSSETSGSGMKRINRRKSIMAFFGR